MNVILLMMLMPEIGSSQNIKIHSSYKLGMEKGLCVFYTPVVESNKNDEAKRCVITQEWWSTSRKQNFLMMHSGYQNLLTNYAFWPNNARSIPQLKISRIISRRASVEGPKKTMSGYGDVSQLPHTSTTCEAILASASALLDYRHRQSLTAT